MLLGVNQGQVRRHYSADDEGSDMGDFLVEDGPIDGYDDDDRDGTGGGHLSARAVNGSHSTSTHHMPRNRKRDGPTFDQMKDATDIFGDGFDDFDDEEELEEHGEHRGIEGESVSQSVSYYYRSK